MDDADSPPAVRDGEPGVLGNLPTTRPQHRSARRRSTRSDAAPSTTAGPATIEATGPPGSPSRRGLAVKPAAVISTAAPAPEPTAAPDVPAPPPAPRSGWATPEPTPPPVALPPLVALADGVARTGAQLLRGALRRLPGV